jgi:hypothetical protein
VIVVVVVVAVAVEKVLVVEYFDKNLLHHVDMLRNNY